MQFISSTPIKNTSNALNTTSVLNTPNVLNTSNVLNTPNVLSTPNALNTHNVLNAHNVLNTTAIPLLYIPSPIIPFANGATTDIQTKCTQLTQENANLRQQSQRNSNIVKDQKRRITLLEKKLTAMEAKVNNKLTELESELETVREELDTKNDDIKKIRNDLSNLLSETQLDILTRKMETVHWNASDMAKAFTIYYFSKECYLYLKHNLKYPLPSISAVEQWASRNEVVLRIPAYEILNGLKSVNEKPRKRRRMI